MKYFQNTADQSIWAFDDDVKFVNNLGIYSFATAADVPLTKLPTTLQPIAEPPQPAPIVNYPSLAQEALDKSDVAIIRCAEHGVAVPADWTAYRGALRDIVNGTTIVTVLPVVPPYPAGT